MNEDVSLDRVNENLSIGGQGLDDKGRIHELTDDT